MKKFLLILITAVLAFISPGCSKQPEEVSTKEQTIIELALFDIRGEVDPDKASDATLIHIRTENVPWLEWDCATYILFVDDKAYGVGVQEKGDEVHFVDVEGELVYASH